MFWLTIIFSTLALALILVGIWYEEKLIAFEDRLWDYIADRIGYYAAQVVIWHRRRKAAKLRAKRQYKK